LEKKENKSEEVSLLLFPLPLAETRKMDA